MPPACREPLSSPSACEAIASGAERVGQWCGEGPRRGSAREDRSRFFTRWAITISAAAHALALAWVSVPIARARSTPVVDEALATSETPTKDAIELVLGRGPMRSRAHTVEPEATHPESARTRAVTSQPGAFGDHGHRIPTSRRASASNHGTPSRPSIASESESSDSDLVRESTIASLGRSLPHAIVHIASTDSTWSDLPFGSGGHATITINFSSHGTPENVSMHEKPPEALRRAVDRAVASLKHRRFFGGDGTNGISVHAIITAVVDPTPPSTTGVAQGDVFAIGSSTNEAFVNLRTGRRITIRFVPRQAR